MPHVTLKSIANNPEIDGLYERMHPTIEAALTDLSESLADSPSFPRRRESRDEAKNLDARLRGHDEGEDQDLDARLRAHDADIKEWEMPFDFAGDWLDAARTPFEAFGAARQAMRKRMDASIAAQAELEVLYDRPEISPTKLRISGPFTVEAVPFATVLALDEAEQPADADVAVARSGETARRAQWRDELLKAGIRGKGGQKLRLADQETLPGARYVHAVGTVAETGGRVAVSFGRAHAALEQRQVEIAMREAGDLFPLPRMLVFCAFTFDPEAAKDGWYRLKKDIRAELDEALLARFHGTVSLPFEAGKNGRIAVKIVDDRGIESLKVMDLD